MQHPDASTGKTPKIIQNPIDKANIKIHNILPSIERTFLKIGSTIGKYNIIEEIDRGGMAVVYKALQLDLNREVALKVLPANITINHRFVERFLSEAHAVAKLQHPYIVNIHEVAVENNVYYLAMDYIPGMNLYYYLNFQKPKLVDVLEIAVKLTDALAYAHRQKIIHRDLKLNNIIMRDNVTPVLIDFGLAKALEGEEVALTKTGEIMGSPAYMAPERLSGANSDARSDICSMGIMLYEMLTFKNPYLDPRSMPQTTRNVMEANPILPRKIVPWLPVEIEAITLKAMHKDPDNRYQTMEDFRDDIRRYQKGEPVLANPPSIWSIGKRFWHVYWALLVIGLLIVVFSSLFLFSLYLDKKKEQPFWYPSYQDAFNGASLDKNWKMYPANKNNDTLTWRLFNKALRSSAIGSSFITLDRFFSRDIRVEFDVSAVNGNFSNAGFFISGNCPDSGYCFHIHRGPEARCGISFPGDDFLFSDIDPFELVASTRYHVAVEKKDNLIVFRINDKLIAKMWDFVPSVGKNHRQMGFFVNGTPCDFDNIKVFTYHLPLLRGPTVVADGFAQRGEYADAVDEYGELFQELSHTNRAGELLLKMCNCQIRLGNYGDALKLFNRLKDSVKVTGALLLQRLFLEGMVYSKMDSLPMAGSAFSRLFALAPESPFSQSARLYAIASAAIAVEKNNEVLAEHILAPLLSNGVEKCKAYGRIYLMIMERYREKGEIDRAKIIGNMLLSHFKSDAEILILARISLARVYLADGKKAAAIDLLNQSISTLVPSESVWQAWLALADIYEYDANFSDAFTIYKKVFTDCPKYLTLPWMARIKMGEIADKVTSEERPDKIFATVITSSHPYLFSRRIAQFYTGGMNKEEFKKFWLSLYSGDKGYIYYFGRKALIDHDPERAGEYFESFLRTIVPNTWTAMQVQKMLSLLKK